MSENSTSTAFRFHPALIDSLKDYSMKRFVRDLRAGASVGIVALPLAIAFGINSGVTPQAGLWTAVIAGFLISALGGSRSQIGGPTGASVPILIGIVAQFGVEKMAVATLMAGVILVVMGIARMGKVIKFIPYPVTMGFTSGVGVIIFSSQIKDILGLQLMTGERLPSHAYEQWIYYFHHLSGINTATLLMAIPAVMLMFLWPRKWSRHVPASIVVLILCTLIVSVFAISPEAVPTIGSRFHHLSHSFPSFQFPELSFTLLQELAMPALSIAILGAIVSLLSAVVADGLTDERHDSNQELIAQGIANICSPLFGGIPANGAIARTVINIRSGAASPISGIIHALFLMAIILMAAPLVELIPLASLAAILVFVSYNMGDWHLFTRLPKLPRSDAAVFLATFGLTVFANLTVAVIVGMVLASILFINRVADISGVTAFEETTPATTPDRDFWIKNLPRGVDAFRVQGAFFFGTADKLETALRRAHHDSTALILVMDQALSMDASSLRALESIHSRLKAKGKRLIICGARPHILELLTKSGFIEVIGAHNVVDTLFHAIMSAKTLSSEMLETPDEK